MPLLTLLHPVLVQVEAPLERRSSAANVVFLVVLRPDSGPVNNRLD